MMSVSDRGFSYSVSVTANKDYLYDWHLRVFTQDSRSLPDPWAPPECVVSF